MDALAKPKLLELVDALTASDDDAPALLVQNERDWAAVAVKPNGILLVLLDACEGVPWEILATRASAVLKTEQPEVLQGLCPGVMAVALLDGTRTEEELADAPARIEAMNREVRWYVIGGGRPHGDKRKLRAPEGRAMADVESALFNAVTAPTGAPVPSARRRTVESQGEATLAAEATFRAATAKRYPPATTGLLAAFAAIFLLERAWGASGSVYGLARMGAISGTRVAAGHYEELLASGLLHAGLMHLLMNGLALASLGRLLERTIGGWRFLLVFTASVLGGSLAAAALNPHTVGVGASGGIFGVMTAILGLTLRRGGAFPALARQRLRQALVSSLVFNFAISLLPGISLLAHAGGGAVGLVLGISGIASAGVEIPWLPRPHTDAVDRLNARFRAIGATCVVLLAMSLAIAFAKGRPWDFEVDSVRGTTIPGTRWTIQIPSNLSPHEGAASAPDGRQVTYGDAAEDPLVIRIRTSLVPADTASFDAEAVVRERAAAQAKALEVTTTPEMYRRAGTPLSVLHGRSKNWAESAGWVFWTDDRLVEITAVLAPGTSGSWRDRFRAISPTAP
jgi:membrane associated rhomboid family serine protease